MDNPSETRNRNETKRDVELYQPISLTALDTVSVVESLKISGSRNGVFSKRSNIK